MKEFKFNAAALAGVTKGMPRLRMRTADMGEYIELQVLPTTRASAANLPKGEILVEVDGDGTAQVPEELLAGVPAGEVTFMVLQPRKHGWNALVHAVATSEESTGANL